jgi:hypothetical protein
MSVVKKSGEKILFASERLKSNYEIVKEAVTQHGYSLFYASREFLDNYEIVMLAIENGIFSPHLMYMNVFTIISNRLKDNHDIMIKGRKKKFENIYYASVRLQSDFKFLFDCIESYDDMLKIQKYNLLSFKSKYLLMGFKKLKNYLRCYFDGSQIINVFLKFNNFDLIFNFY